MWDTWIIQSRELPPTREQRKVKYLHTFTILMQNAVMGDRAAACVTQFKEKQLERSVRCQLDYMQAISAAVMLILKAKNKFHASVGYMRCSRDSNQLINQGKFSASQVEPNQIENLSLEFLMQF